jgi:hypothetical protein
MIATLLGVEMLDEAFAGQVRTIVFYPKQPRMKQKTAQVKQAIALLS